MKQLRVDQTQLDPVILPRVSSGVEPQHLLLALLGEHWFRRSEAIPSAALVSMLADFGIAESSARQSMRRLAARDLLVARRNGRTTSYGFPLRSDEVIEYRMRQVIGFGKESPQWDGQWTVVNFSIPESDRELRRVLRNQLRSMRFGMLQDAIWINPHDRAKHAVELLDQMQVETGYVFRAVNIPRAYGSQGINEIFGIEELGDKYREFISEYRALAEGKTDVENPLVTRTKLVNRWLTFRTEDPELPESLLPESWPRAQAHQIFLAVYDRLGPGAEERFRQIISETDPQLALLASHISSEFLSRR